MKNMASLFRHTQLYATRVPLLGLSVWKQSYRHRFWARAIFGFSLGVLLTGLLWVVAPSSGLTQDGISGAEGPAVEETSAELNAEQAETPDTTTAASEAKATTPVETLKVPVDIQGRRLFRVAGAGDISAERRAADIKQKLSQLDLESSVPKIQVRQEEGPPTLWLRFEGADESYLMTVTQSDAAPQSPIAVADTWADMLRTALNDTHRELGQSRQSRLFSALGIAALALAAQFILLRIWRWGLHRLMQLMGSESESEGVSSQQLLNLSCKVLLLLLLGWLWISAGFAIANLFPVTRQISNGIRDNIIDALTSRLIPIGDGYSLLSFVLLAAVLISLVIASSALTDFLRTRFLGALGVGVGIQEAIAVVFKYCFITLGFVIALQLWGIDLSSLAIFASALSVGIGFGLQDIAKNLGSGFVLVFERPIQVGDFVEVGGYVGTIEKLSARSTRIRTMDDLTVFVPNSRFLEEEVINWSHRHSPSRIKVPVGVAYGSDLEVVTEALLEAAAQQKSIAKAPKPQVSFLGFGDSSLDFVLLVWISRPQLHVRIKSELNYKIDAAFRKHNIEIPFPQQDLHIRSGNLPVLIDETKRDFSPASSD